MTDQTNDTSNTETIATPEHAESSVDNKRRIKSFVLRQGRMSQSQHRSMENNWPKFGLEVEDELLDLDNVFGRKEAPTIVEIGFGMGTSLVSMAEANPDQNYIGIEVHRPGVGALLKMVEEKGLTNIRVFNHDAIEVLEKRIPKNSLAGVYLFFPDPWHKKRHNKRRIVQTEFAKTLATHLKPGGHFHMATDWEDYAEHMMEVMSAAPDYKNTQQGTAFTPRPDYRPLTKFEARGHRLGHGVWDLIFEKIEA